MKRILEIAFCIITLACSAQDVKIMGVYVYYESEDSSANYSFHHSTTIYNSEHKKIYEETRRELGNEDDAIFFEDYRMAPELIIKGFISNGDTSKYIYTQNCFTGKQYIIQDGDTTNRYDIECVDNEVVKITSTKGYETSDTLIRVDNIDYWRTTLPNGNIEYSLRKFDSKRRMTLYRSGLISMTDSTGNFTRFDYDDEKHIETITSSSIGVENKYITIVIYYCDENWITIKREVIEIHDGVKTLRRFEYTRIK